jgi:hypothetical protein
MTFCLSPTFLGTDGDDHQILPNNPPCPIWRLPWLVKPDQLSVLIVNQISTYSGISDQLSVSSMTVCPARPIIGGGPEPNIWPVSDYSSSNGSIAGKSSLQTILCFGACSSQSMNPYFLFLYHSIAKGPMKLWTQGWRIHTILLRCYQPGAVPVPIRPESHHSLAR